MRRMVSYIYSYEGNDRKENVGFGKFDMDSHMIKANISLRYDGIDKYLKVYFFVRNNNEAVCIYIGNALKKGNCYEHKSTSNIEVLTESQYRSSDVYGLYVEGDDTKFISYWGEEYVIENVTNCASIMADEVKETGESIAENKDVIQVEDEDSVYLLDKRCLEKKSANQKCGSNKYIRGYEINNEYEYEVSNQAQNKMTNEVRKISILGNYWDETSIETHMIDGKELYTCQIAMDDLYRLPRNYWCIRRNAYLYQGYMKHGRIWLIEKNGLYVAVPGYLTVNDEIMSRKYGFGIFMECDENGLMESSVMKWMRGFWCKKVE